MDLYMAIQVALQLHGRDRQGRENTVKIAKDSDDINRLCDISALATTVGHKLQNSLGVLKTIVFNLKLQNDNAALNTYLVDMEHILSEGNTIINEFFAYSQSHDILRE